MLYLDKYFHRHFIGTRIGFFILLSTLKSVNNIAADSVSLSLSLYLSLSLSFSLSLSLCVCVCVRERERESGFCSQSSYPAMQICNFIVLIVSRNSNRISSHLRVVYNRSTLLFLFYTFDLLINTCTY